MITRQILALFEDTWSYFSHFQTAIIINSILLILGSMLFGFIWWVFLLSAVATLAALFSKEWLDANQDSIPSRIIIRILSALTKQEATYSENSFHWPDIKYGVYGQLFLHIFIGIGIIIKLFI